jgi:CDP-diacylglycerol--glycerol-3-phosphate 3-phosphatidyltransferase
MLDGQFRSNIETWVRPIGRSVKRTGVSADLVTMIGLVMAVACAVLIGMGWLSLGLLFMILCGIPDLIDGAVAKASGTANPRGAFFDSVTDRVTDGLLFGGVAWYFTTISDGPLPLLPFAVYVTASVVSYIRAKADALGFDAHVGLIERAERFILLGLGLLFPSLLIGVMWLLVALNVITASQRFVAVWRQASVPLPRTTVRSRRRAARVGDTSAAERWRARRASGRERIGARRRPR